MALFSFAQHKTTLTRATQVGAVHLNRPPCAVADTGSGRLRSIAPTSRGVIGVCSARASSPCDQALRDSGRGGSPEPPAARVADTGERAIEVNRPYLAWRCRCLLSARKFACATQVGAVHPNRPPCAWPTGRSGRLRSIAPTSRGVTTTRALGLIPPTV